MSRGKKPGKKLKKKTHKGLKKRFKVSGTGKVLSNKVGGGHLLSHKSAKRRRRLRGENVVEGKVAATIREQLGA